MKFFAVLVGASALSAWMTALWLVVETLRFALGADYVLFHDIGNGNGLGIFVPAIILLAVGWYLARFARSLWSA